MENMKKSIGECHSEVCQLANFLLITDTNIHKKTIK